MELLPIPLIDKLPDQSAQFFNRGFSIVQNKPFINSAYSTIILDDNLVP